MIQEGHKGENICNSFSNNITQEKAADTDMSHMSIIARHEILF
jgi:hypothetical protein